MSFKFMPFQIARRLSLHYSFLFTLLGLLTACGGSGTEDSSSNTLSGSVGDGPIIGATLTITDANGQVLVSAESDSTANYEVELPDSASYPLIITATGGTDLVTGTPPTFAMVSTVSSPRIVTANINPFSTLIVKTAQAMPGGLNSKNLDVAKQNILQHLNFGIDATLMPDPITTPVTEQNVANIVKASETFAETIRRTNAALLAMGTSINDDQLIDALAADMTDGQLDGIGAENTNPLFSATANVVSGQVLIEALNNNLYVNGVSATDQLDYAISVTMPTATTTTAGVVANSEMIAQAKVAVRTARAAAPSDALSSIAIVLDKLSLESPTAPGDSNTSRPAEKLTIVAAQASSYDVDRGRVPENAIDGDLQTNWTTLDMPQWISLDLGEIQRVSKTRIDFYGANAGLNYDYTVSVSIDNTNWSDVVSNASFSLSPEWTEIGFSPIDARYVRISLNSSNASDYANVSEIEIYGIKKTLTFNDILLLLPADTSNDLVQAISSLALLTDDELIAVNKGSHSLGATSEGDAPLFLNWNSNTGIVGYVVYYGATPETAINVASETATTSVRLMRDTDLGLNPGDNVCFRLKAYDGQTLSDFSAAACGTV